MNNNVPPKTRDVKDFISMNKEEIAFVVGNGINRYAFGNNDVAWNAILRNVWNKFVPKYEQISGKFKSDGILYTEFLNILEIKSDKRKECIRDEFLNQLKTIKSTEIHKKLQQFFENLNVPVLTTNFDNALCEELKKFTLNKKHKSREIQGVSFSDCYPWNSYYAKNELNYPNFGFSVWHIHGSVDYKRSVRASLTDYVALISRVRKFIHSSENAESFDKKETKNWKCWNTWLHLLFNRSLVIVGLGLNEEELFLRWLLIERTNFLKKSGKELKSWYLTADPVSRGKRIFLQNNGFEIVKLNDHKEVYEKILFDL